MNATLSRGGTSVTFEVHEEGGELLIGRDIGKPEASMQPVGREDPRSADHKSAVEQFTVVGQLIGSSAYSDARTLAEDLIKPHSGGTGLTIDLSSAPGLGTYEVAPASSSALEVAYPPGRKNWVSLQVSLTVVGSTVG